jgi:integrase
MARKATGQVLERDVKRGRVFALRFYAYGRRQYVTLGTVEEGWTRPRAEDELTLVLAQVRRGSWRPPEQVTTAAPPEVPTFHAFASEWLAGREAAGLRPRTIEYLRWALVEHLLPHFAPVRVDALTIEEVDRYARRKAAEGRLSNGSVNKTLDVLSGVLEAAVEYGHLQRNPAKGKRRRLPTSRPQRSWLDRADHIGALLDGATVLNRRALQRRGQRRALLATLAFAGLRIGEALALTWRDVDLARGTIAVRDSKTAAGVRTVNIVPVLRDELLAYRAGVSDAPAKARVFGTSTGGRQSETNVRRRILAPAVVIANERLEANDGDPLPDRLTPHSLRRTFASILVALGEDPAYVIGQLGHTDPTLTLRIYAREMARRDGERDRLRALVEGRDWAPMGTSDAAEQIAATTEAAA